MKITGISGSPTPGGNNERMLTIALGVAEDKGYDTEKILLSKVRVLPCTDCGTCKNTKECPVEDDMQEICETLEASNAFIATSPVYFGNMSAQLKGLVDRTILLRRNGFLLKGKVGGAIAVGCSHNGEQEFTIQAIHSWMPYMASSLLGTGRISAGSL